MRALSLRVGGVTCSAGADAQERVRALAAHCDSGGVSVVVSRAPSWKVTGAIAVAVALVLMVLGPTHQGWLVLWPIGTAAVWGLVPARTVHRLPFATSSVSVLDENRSAVGAAGGAIAGGLLLGPLGAIAGAAAGARKSHTVVTESEDGTLLVAEVTATELRWLAGLGAIRP